MKPFFILGGGSNVLFRGDYPGMILHPAIRGIEMAGTNRNSVLVRAGAGEDWDEFVSWCVTENLGGLENLSLIPGSVGACPVQNIGAYGVEVGEMIHSVEIINLEHGRKMSLSGSDCRFSYRDSIFKHELHTRCIITHVTFRLSREHQFKTHYGELERELDNFPETSIHTIRKAIISIRSNKLPDPKVLGNAGSFFKNPVIPLEQARSIQKSHPGIPVYPAGAGMAKVSAAWLIEQCGWKGKRSGNTATYKKQPLIIVNLGNATGNEILDFAAKISRSVLNHFAIKLEMEVNVAGD
jgi:UDP-N-acetylmuramate dehydrogenase